MLIFVLMRLVPGDVAEILVYRGHRIQHDPAEAGPAIRAELGLDRPVLVQYARLAGRRAAGDSGYSYMQRRPVAEFLRERFPRSVELAVLTLAIAMVWAIPLGVIWAVRQNTWATTSCALTLSGLSLPIFFTGVLVLCLLVRFFRWLPRLEFLCCPTIRPRI